MNGRIASIDILRGLTILGMVLCAQIGWDSGLPGWMFHAQTPPPDYTFRPDVPGITWVDLVFPLFLFSMGAAFPFSLRKKLDNGQSNLQISMGLLKRWIILSLFSIVLGNGNAINSAEVSPAIKALALLGVWGGLFLSLTRFKTRKPIYGYLLNLAGVAVLAAMAAIGSLLLDIRISIDRINIIITVLANIALFGGLIWLFTKNNTKWRWAVFATVLCLKAVSDYTHILDWIPDIPTRLFSFDYLKYLAIAIPGSIVGDMLLKDSKKAADTSGNHDSSRVTSPLACLCAAAAFIIQLWGLYTRHVFADFIITAVLMICFLILTYGKRSSWSDISGLGFLLLVCGILFDPIEGGIRKDYCNISYLLATGGMAAMATGILLFLERRYGYKGRILAGCGQNPMIAYTATAFLINPVLMLTGLMDPLNSLTPGSPFWGIMRGILITGAVAAVTNIFTRFKIFWRS